MLDLIQEKKLRVFTALLQCKIRTVNVLKDLCVPTHVFVAITIKMIKNAQVHRLFHTHTHCEYSHPVYGDNDWCRKDQT